jgi:hypothetical protein
MRMVTCRLRSSLPERGGGDGWPQQQSNRWSRQHPGLRRRLARSPASDAPSATTPQSTPSPPPSPLQPTSQHRFASGDRSPSSSYDTRSNKPDSKSAWHRQQTMPSGSHTVNCSFGGLTPSLTQDHDLATRRRPPLVVAAVVGRVIVRRISLELRCAGVDEAIAGAQPQLPPLRSDLVLRAASQVRDLTVGKAQGLGSRQKFRIQSLLHDKPLPATH